MIANNVKRFFSVYDAFIKHRLYQAFFTPKTLARGSIGTCNVKKGWIEYSRESQQAQSGERSNDVSAAVVEASWYQRKDEMKTQGRCSCSRSRQGLIWRLYSTRNRATNKTLNTCLTYLENTVAIQTEYYNL